MAPKTVAGRISLPPKPMAGPTPPSPDPGPAPAFRPNVGQDPLAPTSPQLPCASRVFFPKVRESPEGWSAGGRIAG